MTQETCPRKCKAPWIKATATAAGSERRFCKGCKRKWTVDSKHIKKSEVPPCPVCKKQDTVSRAGLSKGQQRWMCSNVEQHSGGKNRWFFW